MSINIKALIDAWAAQDDNLPDFWEETDCAERLAKYISDALITVLPHEFVTGAANETRR
jgi:hypothetical protein